ncbi:MAG: hypothetical protein ACTHMT_03290 [Verrucomicrobiota bacterium]
MRKRSFSLFNILCAAVTLLAVTTEGRAAILNERLRVLSLNLGEQPDRTALIEEVRILMEKGEPDVVTLRGAVDWAFCEAISKLSPGMRVLTCSAFVDANQKQSGPQAAILARDRAVLSWAEKGERQSGYAFAIVQAGTHRVGIFSLENGAEFSAKAGEQGSGDFTRWVASEIKKVQNFPQNKPDSFLLAGAKVGLSGMDADFAHIATDTLPGQRAAADFEMANAGFLARPRMFALKSGNAAAAFCDLQVGNEAATKFAFQTVLLLPGETPAQVEALMHPPVKVSTRSPVVLWGGIAGAACFFLFALVAISGRSKKKSAGQLVALSNGSGGLVNGANHEAVRQGLLEWLKTQFVQRLLFQRQEMITTEQEATRRTLVIEEKLSQLQNVLQEQIAGYESRIQRLEHELTAATSENRDLIRAQIDLLKEKLAKAREDHAYGRN